MATGQATLRHHHRNNIVFIYNRRSTVCLHRAHLRYRLLRRQLRPRQLRPRQLSRLLRPRQSRDLRRCSRRQNGSVPIP